jgi:hypothetical protein
MDKSRGYFGSRTEALELTSNPSRVPSPKDRGVAVVRVPTDVTAAERARWLAELSDALEDAQRLLGNLARGGITGADALDLSARLEAARAQVRSLRSARAAERDENSHPEWTNSLPWKRAVEDCA